MRRIAAIIYGALGQQLELAVRSGRPASATFSVFKQFALDESTAEFSGTATVDTPNTTLSGAAGPSQSDPTRLPLTSIAGVVAGRRYLLAENSVKEWIDVVEVGATYVRGRNPLQNDYTAAATFQSTYLSAAVDATFIANINNLSDLIDTTPDYRVKWTITIGGATQIAYTYFDVVRIAVAHGVELADVDLAAPGAIETMPVQYRAEDGRPLIDRAWHSVRADLVASLIDVNALRDDEVVDELVILRTLRTLAEGGWAPPGMEKSLYLQTATQNYERFLERHIAASLRHNTAERDGSRPVGALPLDRAPWGK
jgi:hypothetical protein